MCTSGSFRKRTTADNTVRLPNPLLIQGVVISTLMGGLMSGLQHVQDDLYPEARFEQAAKEAVDEVAAGDLGGEHPDDRQPLPAAVPELGGLGELGSVSQQQQQAQQGNKWWSWK